jgi:hypothetical protein
MKSVILILMFICAIAGAEIKLAPVSLKTPEEFSEYQKGVQLYLEKSVREKRYFVDVPDEYRITSNPRESAEVLLYFLRNSDNLVMRQFCVTKLSALADKVTAKRGHFERNVDFLPNLIELVRQEKDTGIKNQIIGSLPYFITARNKTQIKRILLELSHNPDDSIQFNALVSLGNHFDVNEVTPRLEEIHRTTKDKNVKNQARSVLERYKKNKQKGDGKKKHFKPGE